MHICKAIIIPALLLAACSPDGSSQAEQQPAAQERVPEPTPEPASPEFVAAKLRSPLPDGLDLPFSYHRLNDNAVKVGGEVQERRVLVEIRQVSPQYAELAMTNLLVEKGFSTPETRTVGSTSESAFARADGAKVLIKIKSRLKKKKAPDATGTMHLVMQF